MPIPSFRHLSDESLMLAPEIESAADQALGIIRQVYRELGPGLTEPVYQEALSIAFSQADVPFLARPRLAIVFRGRELKRRAEPDFLVGEHIVIELKAVDEIHPRHEAQLLTYLRVARRPLGFVVNFNAPRLGEGIRRKVRT